MARVKQRDTKPEMMVRRAVTALEVCYRLQRRDLPGSPDLAFASRRKVVFVRGCIWHAHPGCRHATPKTRTDCWLEKLGSNRHRDARVEAELLGLGWQVTTVWECEIRPPLRLTRLLSTFLDVPVDAEAKPEDDVESFEGKHRRA